MQESKVFWFPAKKYGWGWGLPITWQGWVVLLVFLVLLVTGAMVFSPAKERTMFILYTAAISGRCPDRSCRFESVVMNIMLPS